MIRYHWPKMAILAAAVLLGGFFVSESRAADHCPLQAASMEEATATLDDGKTEFRNYGGKDVSVIIATKPHLTSALVMYFANGCLAYKAVSDAESILAFFEGPQA